MITAGGRDARDPATPRDRRRVQAGVVIHDAVGPVDISIVKTLFREYADALGVDLCFQNFAGELANLPGDYAPPRGCLLIAEVDGAPAGCIALRPLAGDGDQRTAGGEMKRLFVQPRARGTGLGRALAETLLERARTIGYREVKLDTLASMTAARALYASLGFRECAPYYHNPLPGTVYMARQESEDTGQESEDGGRNTE